MATARLGNATMLRFVCGGIIPPQTNLLKSGKRTERVSWIAALKQGDIFAPMTFAGSCNRDLFEMWLERSLLAQLQPGDAKAGVRKNYSPGTLPHRHRQCQFPSLSKH